MTDTRTAPPSKPVDLFEKARDHDRRELIELARQHDLMPYFRQVESESGPVVRMEGSERLMLGSNNYLGLTGDRRVKQAAREALERYGTGLTGSRLMNGTLPMHRELEQELADWMGIGGRARLHDRLSGEPRLPVRRPGPLGHRDRRLLRPRIDPRRLQALRSAPAALPAPADRQARDDARARRGRRRRRPGGRGRRLFDGGRHLRPPGRHRAAAAPMGRA